MCSVFALQAPQIRNKKDEQYENARNIDCEQHAMQAIEIG